MNLLCFLADLDGGGAERTMVNLCRGFLDNGVAPILAIGRIDGPARNWLDPRVELINLGAKRARNTFLPLRRLLSQRRPDVLFATKLDANIVAAAAVRSSTGLRPSVVLRETNSHLARGDVKGLRKLVTGITYRHADFVVALSTGVGQELQATYGVSATKVKRISNPVNVEEISQAAMQARLLSPPIPKTGRLIVAAGRLTRQKGFDLLLEAFAKCNKPSELLAIVGEGEDRESLAALARTLGISDRVTFPGFVAAPHDWFAHADLFVLSSRWEGFGHVIVEAMASGAPVVAFNCPHGPRDILENNVNGILVPPEDVTALGSAMRRILDSPQIAADLSSTALSMISKFARDRIAQQYLALFKDVLAARSKVE